MKSKSFNLKQKTPEGKLNKTFNFTAYYKTAAETNKVLANSNVTSGSTVSNKQETNHNESKRERSPKKKINKPEPIDISIIDIEGSSLNSSGPRGTPLNESKVTSTPQGSQKNRVPTVKSIMKNSLDQGEDDNMDESQYFASPVKSKKRNKSVSFMLEETEQVAVKKTKSNDSIDNKPSKAKKADLPKEKIRKFKKLKSDFSEKENKDNGNVNMETVDVGKVSKDANQSAKNSNMKQENPSKDLTVNNVEKEAPTSSNLRKENQNKKRKLKKIKKQNSEESTEAGTENNNNEEQVENKHKKLKKKKSAKPTQTVETKVDGEPSSKTRKKDVKPEAIVENLENLSIGDNAHTLTNLLDDMTVAEKDKRKKNKRKIKKDKKPTGSTTSSENAESEKVVEEEKEKVKWKKRKWNKDKKGDVDEDAIPNSVIVDNLPLSMMCDYKKILSDHFGKHGIIKKIGIAELYPTEESKPVFTTTINFYSDGAATKALEENNTIFEGSRIHVRQALPATQTTLVVRSYAELTDQALSTTFLPAGKIRNIRHLVKGKKAIATAFIEFDGPEVLEKALKLGQETKIAGKKMHVSRFEVRKKKKKTRANSENEGDSENSD